jgi:hypothetical protein
MKASRTLSLLRYVLFGLLLMALPSAAWAQSSNKALILDTTVITPGTSSVEALEAVSLGLTVEVVNGTQWAAKTTADFASYRVIILGDRSCGSSYTAAIANRNVWSAAVDGNVIINGTDPIFHQNQNGGAGRILTQKSVDFAANQVGKTGLYVSLSCSGANNAPLLGLGNFTVVNSGDCFNPIHIVASHPSLTGLTDPLLSNWGCSAHEGFTAWPASFEVLALVTGNGATAFTAPDGTTGLPYILARGAGLTVLSDISLSPTTSSLPLSSSQVMTATVKTNGVPVNGTTVTFTVLSGPDTGSLGTAVTNSSGVATKILTNNGIAGTDVLRASFVDVANRTQTSGASSITFSGPTPPGFTFDRPLPDTNAKICLPPFMVQDRTATHVWWAKATGSRPLDVQLVGVGVNASESITTLTMKVYSPTNTLMGTTTITQPGMGEFPAVPVSVGASAGQLYRVEVTVSSAGAQPARHYRLVLQGASQLGTNSALQAQAEESDARWGINAAAGQNFSISALGGPEAPITTGALELRNPSDGFVGSITIPGTASVTNAAAGQWLASISGADHHYILDKTAGDRGIYVNWLTYGNSATISGNVTRGGAPNTVPITLEVVSGLSGQILTISGVTGNYSVDKLLPGSYTVRIPGGQSQNVTITCDGTATANFDLEKLTPTINVTGGTFEYDGLPHPATATATGPGDIAVSGSIVLEYLPGGAAEPVARGTYAVTARFTSSEPGFNDATGTGSILINPRPASVSPFGATKVYGEVDPPFDGNLAGFLPADGVTATYSRTVGEDVVGSPYTISATLAPPSVLDNYDVTYNTALFTITKASTTVTVTCEDGTYAGTALENCEAEANSANGFHAHLHVDYTNNVYAGTAQASAHFDGDDNHFGSDGTGSFTILRRAATVTVDAKHKVYGDADPELTGTLSNFVDSIPVTYSREPGQSVGTYLISAVLTPCIPPAPGGEAPPKPAPVPAPATGPAPGGAASSSSSSSESGSAASAPDKPATEPAPKKTEKTKSPESSNCWESNYEVTYVTANLDITPRLVTVTADAKSKVYGTADPELTYQVTAGDLASGDSFSGALTRNPGDNAGTYAITQGTLALSSDYTLTYIGANLTIDKASSTVTVTCPTNPMYNASAHTPCSAVVTGVGGLNEVLTPSYSNNINAGTNTALASASYAGDDNHNSSSGSANFSILKAPSTTTVTCPVSVPYNATAQTPCSAVATGVGNLNATVTPTYTNNVIVGQATASATYAGDNNHDGSTGSANFDITKIGTSTTITSSVNPSLLGTSVTFFAKVTSTAGAPSGLVTFTDGATVIGTGMIGAGGIATFQTSLLAVGSHPIVATYGGDNNFTGSASTPLNQIVYAFAGTGSFVIGDKTAAPGVGTSVTFWDAQWEKKNSLSGPMANASFKGFANRTTTTPPSVGGTWYTDPGNSSNPPASIPAYMGVIVASTDVKNGSTISGNTVKIVVVQTNAGYDANPGHAGTGTIISVLP